MNITPKIIDVDASNILEVVKELNDFAVLSDNDLHGNIAFILNGVEIRIEQNYISPEYDDVGWWDIHTLKSFLNL